MTTVTAATFLFALLPNDDPPGGPGMAAVVVVVLLLVPVALVRARGRYDFAVVIDRTGGVRFKGKFPPGYRPAATEFLRQQQPALRRLKVLGTWSGGGRLRVRVVGAPSTGDAQRVRNFFMTTLRR